MAPRISALLPLALGALAGCGADPETPERPLTEAERLDPQACAACHPEHVRQWSRSMHAYAADSPVFRAMNARAQRESGGAVGDLCVRCHAPLALRLGLTTDGLNLDELPPTVRGVTCAFCHAVDAVEGTHNNPLRLAADGVLRGGIADPSPTTAHASAWSPFHDRRRSESSAMCGACHDVVTPAGLALERTYAEWRASVFAADDPVSHLSCGQCHMPARPGLAATAGGELVARQIHDHTMPGAGVPLTPTPEREVLRAAVQEALDTAVYSELCVRIFEDGAMVELVLENIGAGHGIPSGASHYRRLWVELVARRDGEVVQTSGLADDATPLRQLPERDLWVLGETLFDAEGRPVHGTWEAAGHEAVQLAAPKPAPDGGPPQPVHALHRYLVLGAPPDEITVRVRLRPYALDLLDDLVESGDLDPAVRDRAPTFTLAGATRVWTPSTAVERPSLVTGRLMSCAPP